MAQALIIGIVAGSGYGLIALGLVLPWPVTTLLDQSVTSLFP